MRKGPFLFTLSVACACAGCRSLSVAELEQRLERQQPATITQVAFTDSLFLHDVVNTGVWRPERFAKTIGFRILLTKPHQTGRIPVVLLHGYGGSPREMEAMAQVLESDTYELWYGYYPTGAKLADLSAAFSSELSRVAAREGVPEVIIVGFSLGGLVARSALALNRQDSARISALIAIGTPWNGIHKAGHWSWLPGAPPCWKDLHPESRFLRRLFDRLPPGVQFHVLYSTGDQVVQPGSLRRAAALAQATSVTALPGKHSDPVFYQAARERVRQLLEQATSASREGGRLAQAALD